MTKEQVRAVRAKGQDAGCLDGTRPVPAYPEPLFPDDTDGRTPRRERWRVLGLIATIIDDVD